MFVFKIFIWRKKSLPVRVQSYQLQKILEDTYLIRVSSVSHATRILYSLKIIGSQAMKYNRVPKIKIKIKNRGK